MSCQCSFPMATALVSSPCQLPNIWYPSYECRTHNALSALLLAIMSSIYFELNISQPQPFAAAEQLLASPLPHTPGLITPGSMPGVLPGSRPGGAGSMPGLTPGSGTPPGTLRGSMPAGQHSSRNKKERGRSGLKVSMFQTIGLLCAYVRRPRVKDPNRLMEPRPVGFPPTKTHPERPLWLSSPAGAGQHALWFHGARLVQCNSGSDGGGNTPTLLWTLLLLRWAHRVSPTGCLAPLACH